MPLSTAAQEELRAELAAIETLRRQMNEKFDARASVIKAVLEPFEFGQPGLPFAAQGSLEALPTAETGRVTGTGRAHLDAVQTSKFAGTGLRAAILDALRSHGPMRAPQVARILEATGFRNDSTTKLAIRVYNDLWRLKEANIVRNNDGVFSLREAA